MIQRPQSIQPVPDSATVVFKGKLFTVLQWEQQMFDGSFQTFEKVQRPDTVLVLPVTEQGKILMVQEKQPGKPQAQILPGGRLEHGETVEQCAQRELFEETGYTCEAVELLYSVQPQSKIEWAIYLVIARNCTFTTHPPSDPGENISVQEVDFDNFMHLMVQDAESDREVALFFLKAKINNQVDDLKKLILSPQVNQ